MYGVVCRHVGHHKMTEKSANNDQCYELNRYPLSTRIVLGVTTSGFGLLFMLLYAGVLPWKSPYHCRAVFCNPYH